MASHTANKKTASAPRRRYGPRRTVTIGVRLTPAEIAALDAYVAQQTHPGLSTRAGAVANIALDELVRQRLLNPAP